MDECIESLKTANVFSTLDANSDYEHIELAENDTDNTAFVTPDGVYKNSRMALELKNACATFQPAMDIILAFVL